MMDTVPVISFIEQWAWAFILVAFVLFVAFHFHVAGKLAHVFEHGHAPPGTTVVPIAAFAPTLTTTSPLTFDQQVALAAQRAREAAAVPAVSVTPIADSLRVMAGADHKFDADIAVVAAEETKEAVKPTVTELKAQLAAAEAAEAAAAVPVGPTPEQLAAIATAEHQLATAKAAAGLTTS